MRIVRPDFLIFSRQADGPIAVGIVDLHGTQFNDALPKLKGLAAYAERHADKVRRVDAIAAVGDKLEALDLTDAGVRAAVAAAADARGLYGEGRTRACIRRSRPTNETALPGPPRSTVAPSKMPRCRPSAPSSAETSTFVSTTTVQSPVAPDAPEEGVLVRLPPSPIDLVG